MVGGNASGLIVDCQWGRDALRSAKDRVVIVVDVLSFSTATCVGVSRGAEIIPCAWDDARASALAKSERALLASKRGKGPFSLAPASLMKLPKGAVLVLPSPNGSTLAEAAMAADAAAIVSGCLRNAGAVAGWASRQPRDIVVVAAGERRADGTIRFAVEDWLGAGAITARIARRRRTGEADAAAGSFERLRHRLRDVLAECESGRELIDAGYPDDIDLAAQLDADDCVPLLRGNAFTLAPSV